LAVLAVFALMLVVLGVATRPDKAGISKLAGHPVLSVSSGSMTPVFRAGDLVVDNAVSREQAARLRPGDIITFHVPGLATELVTHRIVAVLHPSDASPSASVRYQTKGDANDSPDVNAVSAEQVVGTYRMRLTHAGYILRAARTKTVYFFLILLPALYVIGSVVSKWWREPATPDSPPGPETGGGDSADTTDPGTATKRATREVAARGGGGPHI
jgi:signal peptidase